MKKVLFLFILLFTMLSLSGKSESNDLKSEWLQWRCEVLGLNDEFDWDGLSFNIYLDDQIEFWQLDSKLFPQNIIASSYSVDNKSQKYAVKDGILFSADYTILYRYPPMKQGWYYQVPSTVRRIEESAFKDNYFLKEVIIPDSVIDLEGCDTFNRSRINRIHFPDSIKQFNVEGIANLPLITSIVIKEGSLCWQELVFAKEYIDFFALGLIELY